MVTAHAGAAAAIVRVATSGIDPGAADRRAASPDVITGLGMQDNGATEPLAKHELGGTIRDRRADGEIEQRKKHMKVCLGVHLVSQNVRMHRILKASTSSSASFW
eukprot:671122-Amphidinium_carterae.1